MPINRTETARRRRIVRRTAEPIEWDARASQGWSGPVKTVNLVTRDNGVGLTTDLELLESVLAPAGIKTRRVNYREWSMPRCDLAVFLELFNPRLIQFAHRTVGVFNLEWFLLRWEPYLPKFDQLWSKSLEAQQVYDKMNLHSDLVGFASRDLYRPEVARVDECFHLRGHSSLKNTEAVLEAWRRNPDLPPLTVVSVVPLPKTRNVEVLPRLEQDQLVEVMNAKSIHLCPSRSEGWGHYITEGMTTKAAVVTTDASPMNEHIQPGRGVLVPSTGTRARGRVVEHDVDPDAIAQAVRDVLDLSKQQRVEMGEAARSFVLDRNVEFASRILALIKEL